MSSGKSASAMRCLWKLSFIATVDVFPPVVRPRKSVLLSMVSISTRSASPRDFLQRARVISFPHSCRVPYVGRCNHQTRSGGSHASGEQSTHNTRNTLLHKCTSYVIYTVLQRATISRYSLGQGFRHREFDCFLSCSGGEEVRALLHPLPPTGSGRLDTVPLLHLC